MCERGTASDGGCVSNGDERGAANVGCDTTRSDCGAIAAEAVGGDERDADSDDCCTGTMRSDDGNRRNSRAGLGVGGRAGLHGGGGC